MPIGYYRSAQKGVITSSRWKNIKLFYDLWLWEGKSRKNKALCFSDTIIYTHTHRGPCRWTTNVSKKWPKKRSHTHTRHIYTVCKNLEARADHIALKNSTGSSGLSGAERKATTRRYQHCLVQPQRKDNGLIHYTLLNLVPLWEMFCSSSHCFWINNHDVHQRLSNAAAVLTLSTHRSDFHDSSTYSYFPRLKYRVSTAQLIFKKISAICHYTDNKSDIWNIDTVLKPYKYYYFPSADKITELFYAAFVSVWLQISKLIWQKNKGRTRQNM